MNNRHTQAGARLAYDPAELRYDFGTGIPFNLAAWSR